MSTKTVKRLFDLEIDEVSLVDRPANQHGLVAIAKRAEDDGMPIFDAEGYEVDESDLEHGDVVYADNGDGSFTELVYTEDPAEADLGPEGGQYDGGYAGDDYLDEVEDAFDDERELAGVGKAMSAGQRMLLRGGIKGRAAGRTARGTAGAYGREAGTRARALGRRGALRNDIRFRSASGRAPYATAGAVAGAGGAAGAGAGYAGGRRRRGVQKGLGDSIYSELSKALGDADRDEIIGKAMDYIDAADARAEEAWNIAKGLQEERELSEFVELAREYNLPADPVRIGSILKRAAATLPQADVAELDRLFSSVGELGGEIGVAGGYGGSAVMDQVSAMALEAVGKSDGITPEQAVVALFEANPGAYDEYLTER